MNKMRLKMKALIGILLVAMILTSSINLPSAYATAEAQQSQVWSFGVISDTQWTVADDGFNPNTVAANIITQVDKQFIKYAVDKYPAFGRTVDL